MAVRTLQQLHDTPHPTQYTGPQVVVPGPIMVSTKKVVYVHRFGIGVPGKNPSSSPDSTATAGRDSK